MLGLAVDITDRKMAEEAIADVGRRLIEAHREERTWIARESHDDLSQRPALLVIELRVASANKVRRCVTPGADMSFTGNERLNVPHRVG